MVRTPIEVIEETYRMTVGKYNKKWREVALLAVMGGAYIAMGGFLSTLVGKGVPEIATSNPGIARLLSGATFPLGLILVVLTGAELFTSNNAVLIPALLKRQVPWHFPLKFWAVVYLFNFVGAAAFAYLMIYSADLMSGDIYRQAAVAIAEGKAHLSFMVAFWRGVGANWLVCLAVWLGLASSSVVGKMWGLWWPVMAFVAMGMEHSIANMYYLPMGMLLGADISAAELIGNLLPVTLGNMVGGALFVGGYHALLFGKKATPPRP